MRVRVQIIVEVDDDTPPAVHEVACVERGDLHIDTLGLRLAEAKDLLQKVQEVVIAEQVSSCLVNQVACPHCHRARCHKDATTIVVRTLFRHAPPAQSALVALLLSASADPHVQSAGRRSARAHHTRTDLSREQVLRLDLVWPERQLAGRDTATWAAAPRRHRAAARAGNS